MRRFVLSLAAAAALVIGCGGGGGSAGGGAEEPDTTQEVPTEEAERQQAVEKLDRYQAAACERVCPRLTQCAEASARERDPAALEGVPIEELRARHTEKCLDECNGNKMSLRQVEIYYECPEQHDTCEPLLQCLDQASSR